MRFKAMVLGLLFASSAHADFFNGNELLRMIDSQEAVENGAAMGYIAGVFDSTRSMTHCAPATVNLRQVKDIVRKKLIVAPEMRDMSAAFYVMLPLSELWPCPKQNSKGKNGA